MSEFGVFGFDATWLFLATAIGFVCYALLRSRPARPKELPFLVGLPDDIGGAVAALLENDAGWINAQRIEVSGGQGL